MTPYDEINELIRKMKEAKETLNGTDLEYFSKKQLKLLNEISNDLATVSLHMTTTIEDIEKE